MQMGRTQHGVVYGLEDVGMDEEQVRQSDMAWG